MPAPGHLPLPELWDYITEFITAPKDLKSISLTCRSFCSAAQKRLYHDICIEENLLMMSYGYNPANPKAYHLSAILSHSPHILGYIRTLRVYSRSHTVHAVLAAIPWSHLRNLTIKLTPALSGREDVKTLVRIPSLRALYVQFDAPRDDEALFFVLSSCSQNIDELGFLERIDEGDEGQESNISFVPPTLTSPRSTIHSLTLCTNAFVPDVLGNLFDLHSLKNLTWNGVHSPTLERLFAEFGASVEALHLPHGFPDMEVSVNNSSFSLAHFPSLHHLRVNVNPDNDKFKFISPLTTVTIGEVVERVNPTITHLTLEISITTNMRWAKEFEKMLVQRYLELGALQEVRVVLLETGTGTEFRTDDDGDRDRLSIEGLRELFRELQKKKGNINIIFCV
ncbi:hypothetical protein R3P38DRAFT_1120246 [Favolaschia claudopus]|uniref:F-box domain-containing protein n=1 Tax=Favolaschia claudopus TaxID=2862362 RepID=A0AAW0B959_9AGAR